MKSSRYYTWQTAAPNFGRKSPCWGSDLKWTYFVGVHKLTISSSDSVGIMMAHVQRMIKANLYLPVLRDFCIFWKKRIFWYDQIAVCGFWVGAILQESSRKVKIVKLSNDNSDASRPLDGSSAHVTKISSLQIASSAGWLSSNIRCSRFFLKIIRTVIARA